MVAIKLRGITKRFDETQVLHGIDAQIPDGSFAVLVGPSGCGKSTLLRLIAGLEEVTAGTIEFGDRDVTDLPPRDRDIAMVFQSYALYPHMTVRDNLAFGLKLRKTDPATISQRVGEVAATLELEPLLDRYPRQLSGGQRQRVAMGRAIVRRPALFMFDEPLSNLDPALRTAVRIDIRKLHDELGATSVYVTHDQVEAMTLADVLFVLEGGHVQQCGAPLEIYERPANCFVASFLGSPAMNLIPTVARSASVLAIGDGEFGLPNPEEFSPLTKGQNVIVGLRPQDITMADAADADFELDVDVSETLGPTVNIHGAVGQHPFIATIEGSNAPAKGRRVPFRIERLHLFDATSRDSLRRPATESS